MAHAIFERLIAFITLDPQPEVELEKARRRASDGDSCWAEWLHELASGQAIIASLDLVVEIRLAGRPCHFHAERTALWLEVSAHPPLVERQVQEGAIVFLADLERSLPDEVDVSAAQLTRMCVHVDLSQSIRERLTELTGSVPVRQR